MKYTIEVTGIDECINFINSIPNLLKDNDFKQYIGEQCVEVINKVARQKLNVSGNYVEHNKIEILKNGVLIYNDVQSDNGDYYSLVIEYGSGIHKEKDTYSNDPTNTYLKTGGLYWLVPTEKAPSLNGSKIITVAGKQYYIVYGQTPKHIYTDAATIISQNLAKWTKEYIMKL